MIDTTLNKFVVHKNLIRRIYLESLHTIKNLIFKIIILSSNRVMSTNWCVYLMSEMKTSNKTATA